MNALKESLIFWLNDLFYRQKEHLLAFDTENPGEKNYISLFLTELPLVTAKKEHLLEWYYIYIEVEEPDSFSRAV